MLVNYIDVIEIMASNWLPCDNLCWTEVGFIGSIWPRSRRSVSYHRGCDQLEDQIWRNGPNRCYCLISVFFRLESRWWTLQFWWWYNSILLSFVCLKFSKPKHSWHNLILFQFVVMLKVYFFWKHYHVVQLWSSLIGSQVANSILHHHAMTSNWSSYLFRYLICLF
jgi:hypothetical protein